MDIKLCITGKCNRFLGLKIEPKNCFVENHHHQLCIIQCVRMSAIKVCYNKNSDGCLVSSPNAYFDVVIPQAIATF